MAVEGGKGFSLPASISRPSGNEENNCVCEAQLDTGLRRSWVPHGSCKRGIGFTVSSPSGIKLVERMEVWKI